MKDKYSVTSNTKKLFKHMGKLQKIQDHFTGDGGPVSPIMVHVIPTHKCNLKCIHCCFRNRKNKKADMTWEVFETATKQFLNLGVKAFEFSGGGGYWDSGIWDETFWDAEVFSTTGIRLSGSGKNISFLFYGNSKHIRPFRIETMEIHYMKRRLKSGK